MTPTEELMNEHRAILSALEVLEAICGRIDRGELCVSGDVERLLDFLKTFADHCHHAKEEKLLFPALEAAGVPNAHGPIGVMLSEHALGRKYIRGISDALAGLERGEPTSARMLSENGRAYVNLLRAHIMKENEVLFPLADRRLSSDVQAQLSQAFERFEELEIGHAQHDRFHTMMRELHDTYMG
jgi:hemerythrin-like domain-containing protein